MLVKDHGFLSHPSRPEIDTVGMIKSIEGSIEKVQFTHKQITTQRGAPMITNSETKLFCQSALAMAGFLLFLTLVGWATAPKVPVSKAVAPIETIHIQALV